MVSEVMSHIEAVLAANPWTGFKLFTYDKLRKLLDRHVPGWREAIAALPDAAPLLGINYIQKDSTSDTPYIHFVYAILPHIPDHVLQQLLTTLIDERGCDIYRILKGWQGTNEKSISKEWSAILAGGISIAIPTLMGALPLGWALFLFLLLVVAVVAFWFSHRDAKETNQEIDMVVQRLESLGFPKEPKKKPGVENNKEVEL
jgi:hypothetical protein